MEKQNKNENKKDLFFKDELSLEDRVQNEMFILYCLEKGYLKP